MELLNFFAQNKKGDVVPSATVYVYAAGTTSTVDIYDRSGASKGNPFNADGNGFVEFRVADGEYDVRVISGDSEYTLTVQAGDVVQIDAEVQAIKDDASNLLATSPLSEAERSLGEWVEGISYTFDSVAAMKADTLLRVGDRVRTPGYRSSGDGGGNDYEVVADGTGTDDGGSYIDLSGSGFQAKGLFTSGYVRPEQFGATADGSDDADAINTAAITAVSVGATLVLGAGKTYSFSQLVFPANCKLRAAGATLRYLGTLPNLEDIPLTLQARCSFDSICYSSSGTEENNPYAINVEDYVNGGMLSIEADVQKSGEGIDINGNHVHIDYIKARNRDRPVHVGTSMVPTTGSYIGFLDVENYIRGIRYTNHSDFTLGGHFMRGRSPNVPEQITPGHNGILLTGASDFFIGDGRVDDAGEHAYRIGGAQHGGQNHKGKFGSLTAYRPRASAFKVNTMGGADLAEDIEITSIVGVDVGDGGAQGKNPDFLRLTGPRRMRIGYAACHASDLDNSGLDTLTLNNVDGLTIGHLHADGPRGYHVNFTDEKDSPAGPIKNIHIGNVTGTTYSGAVLDFSTTEELENIFIYGMNVTGYSDRIAGFNNNANVVGPIYIKADLVGSVNPRVVSPPDRDDVILDVSYNNTRYFGPAYRYRTAVGTSQMAVEAFDPSDVRPTGLFLNSVHLTPAQGAYGGGVEFGRCGSTRRGAAIVGKHTHSEPARMGLSFCTKISTLMGSDLLVERMVLDHAGNLSVDGAISKGSGTFCIDHPLDPENRDLVHGFVEAPEYGLIYRGRVTLQDGFAEVDIDAACGMEPGTFTALTQMADIQALTNRTGFARLKASEIVEGRFTVEAEVDTADEVAWMVYAARADDFIRESAPWVDSEGRLAPSQQKPLDRIGTRRHGDTNSEGVAPDEDESASADPRSA